MVLIRAGAYYFNTFVQICRCLGTGEQTQLFSQSATISLKGESKTQLITSKTIIYSVA